MILAEFWRLNKQYINEFVNSKLCVGNSNAYSEVSHGTSIPY